MQLWTCDCPYNLKVDFANSLKSCLLGGSLDFPLPPHTIWVIVGRHAIKDWGLSCSRRVAVFPHTLDSGKLLLYWVLELLIALFLKDNWSASDDMVVQRVGGCHDSKRAALLVSREDEVDPQRVWEMISEMRDATTVAVQSQEDCRDNVACTTKRVNNLIWVSQRGAGIPGS
jgi:hypothetical protein